MDSEQKLQTRKEPHSKSEMTELKERYSKGFYKCPACKASFDTVGDIVDHRWKFHRVEGTSWTSASLY